MQISKWLLSTFLQICSNFRYDSIFHKSKICLTYQKSHNQSLVLTNTAHFHAKQCVGKTIFLRFFFWLKGGAGVHGIQIFAYNTVSRFDFIHCIGLEARVRKL